MIETLDGSRPFSMLADRACADRSFRVLAAASAALPAEAREHIEAR